MTLSLPSLRTVGLTTALVTLAACTQGGGSMRDFDWDLRGGNGLDTSGAALQASAARPAPDARGVISYPGYQVAVAQRGDTVGSVAQRVGISPGELASYNAINANAPLREGEVLALPRRVAAASGVAAAPGAPRRRPQAAALGHGEEVADGVEFHGVSSGAATRRGRVADQFFTSHRRNYHLPALQADS